MSTGYETRLAKGQRARRIVANILLGFSILVVLLAAFWAFFAHSKEDAFLFGYKPYIVASESMEPLIEKYAFVLVAKGGYDDVKAGEVIAFKASRIGGKSVLHRVVDVKPEGFVTKGDAVNIADQNIVTGDAFLGRKVWHTNLTAVLYRMLQTPNGVFLVVGLPCAFIAFLVIVTRMVKRTLRR